MNLKTKPNVTNKLNFEEVLPKLIKMEIFSGFDPDKEEDRNILKKVTERLVPQHFKKGETIIREGDKGDGIYLLLQ